ncbi:putative nucleotidyltransferase substrate binding domain-containing protein [uncultured Tessaracoccus sp.]|uniref:putative nucleotidyltransferase substrate binding domain-containing protein n=1 Tax=uncultured Tessaracoccus sp. TaxID=905023 RepID=UPI0025D7860C|nr:putative nucleotidyltransferase substrate binding domain-containing protein [uncultured Tessaracoccus sp.]
MDIEVSEVVDFLGEHAPFDALPDDVRRYLARTMRIEYLRRGTEVITPGAPNDRLFLIRSGAVDIVGADGILIDRNTTGETFGTLSVMRDGPARYTATAIEDTLVLTLDGEAFRRLFDEHRVVADHFTPRQRGRLRRATEAMQPAESSLLALTAADLAARAPVAASPEVPVREAARLMTDEHVSALLVTEGDQLVGILTDRDLRSRVVATGADMGLPVRDVMTATPVTTTPDTRAFELLLTMTNRAVHHLPVVVDGRATGVVSAGDLMRIETANPVFVVGDIARQTDVEGVAAVVRRSPELASNLLARGIRAGDVSRVLTAVVDAATNRLIQLAVDRLGTPPGRWCWVALGSQARRELALGSDQDHALLVDDTVTDLEHHRRLAEEVVAGLEACGLPRCRGDAMATTWHHTLAQWKDRFGQWLLEPEARAILHAQIFFDMRAVDGDTTLFDELRTHVVTAASRSPLFLRHLAGTAVRREPPVGFFRGFVVERSGAHRDMLNVKAGGLHAVIESVRTLALAHAIPDTGTVERIEALRAGGHLGADQAAEVLDAFTFLHLLRLRTHANHVAAGEPPEDFVAPSRLTPTDRRHLREAFAVVRRLEQAVAHRFRTDLLN